MKISVNKAILVGASAILLFSCSEKPKEKVVETSNSHEISLTPAELTQISIAQAQMTDEISELSLTGKIIFNEDHVVKIYPLVSGNVVKVNVSLGDHVRKGDILAVVKSGDISEFENQYNISYANLSTSEKKLDIAEQLYKTNVYSEKDLNEAKNDYKIAQTMFTKSKEQLSIYGVKGGNQNSEYIIKAPEDGAIVEKNVTEGMEIRPDANTNLFTVGSLDKVWVNANVYESDLAKIKLDEEADVTTVAYPDKLFKGKIEKVGDMLDPATRVLKVRISLDNKEGFLKPEMFATIKVIINEGKKVLSIPTKSLVFDNNQFNVVLQLSNGKFKKVPIVVIRNTKEISFIESGIKVGDKIVADGSLLAAYN